MKLSQLLAGTAAVALLSTASLAQTDLTFDSAIAGTNGITTQQTLVTELDFVAANLTTNLELSIEPAANDYAVYSNTAAQLTISLDGFEFSSNIAGGSFSTNWAAGGGACAMSVVAGGAAGDSSVTFETADLSACDVGGGDDMGFHLPVVLTAVPANVSFELRQKANNALIASDEFNFGNANNPESLIEAGDGFEIDFNDNNGNVLTALLADPTYNTLDGNDVGSIDFNANGSIDLAGSSANWTNTNQVDGITVTVTLSNPSGIETIRLEDSSNANLNMEEDLVNGSASFTIDGVSDINTNSLANGLDVMVLVDNDDNTLIGNSSISVSVTTDEATGSDLTIGDASGDLSDIVRQGDTDGPFEWVGDSTKSTANIFRMTGLGDTLPVIRVTLENSTNDMDGEYVLTPTNALTNGELIITNGNITTAVGGNFGRADVTFSYEASGILTRRLMATAGVVTENSTD